MGHSFIFSVKIMETENWFCCHLISVDFSSFTEMRLIFNLELSGTGADHLRIIQTSLNCCQSRLICINMLILIALASNCKGNLRVLERNLYKLNLDVEHVVLCTKVCMLCTV